MGIPFPAVHRPVGRSCRLRSRLLHFKDEGSGVQGAIHLRTGTGAESVFTGEDLTQERLPFSISLSSFEVEYYPGTQAPCDYVSLLEINDGGAVHTLTVAMNRAAAYRGYRFFQSSYDEDGRGSTLAVSHDPVGTPVSYAGYGLLLLSLAAFFFQRGSRFRTILRRVSKGAAVTAVLLTGSLNAPTLRAGTGAALPGHLPEETAMEYGKMLVYYNDRICPMQTLARDFTMKLYGKASYRGLSPEQVLTGWIFHYDDWTQTLPGAGAGASAKEIKKAGERQELVLLVAGASILKIFPYTGQDGTTEWYSPVDRLPAEMDPDTWIFVRKVMSLAGESVAKGDFEAAAGIFRKMAGYQEKTAGDTVPSDGRIAAERLYNRIERPKAAAMGCVSAGILFFLLLCLLSDPGPEFRRAGTVVSAAAFLYLTLVLALSWAVSGHIPLSNGYELMTLLAWHALMLGTFLQRKFRLMIPLSLLLGGFALLVASIGESDPAIAYLVPVLSSPLLSLHVMTMMISYTLLGLVMLNGILSLLKYRRCSTRLSEAADISLIFLYPAVFFLAAGTFIGAVWADISWGRYWGWDPKETWALITLLVFLRPARQEHQGLQEPEVLPLVLHTGLPVRTRYLFRSQFLPRRPAQLCLTHPFSVYLHRKKRVYELYRNNHRALHLPHHRTVPPPGHQGGILLRKGMLVGLPARRPGIRLRLAACRGLRPVYGRGRSGILVVLVYSRALRAGEAGREGLVSQESGTEEVGAVIYLLENSQPQKVWL